MPRLMGCHRAAAESWFVAGFFLALQATTAYAQQPQAAQTQQSEVARLNAVPSIEGRISNNVGEPLMGVLVSVFGGSLRGGGATALTDEQGRFQLPPLPPGFYVLHAYLGGFLPTRSSQVELTPGVPPSPVALSLTPAEGESVVVAATSTEDVDAERSRELKWLLRHGRRNVLRDQTAVVVASVEDEEEAPTSISVDTGVDITGEVGVLASDAGLIPGAGAGLDARLAYAHLDIPDGPDRRWLVSAQLLESVLSSWAARAEFETHARAGQELRAGVAYGNYLYGNLDDYRPPEAGLSRRSEGDRTTEWFGSAYGEHRLKMGDAALETGLNFEHFSYLDRANYFAPRVALAWSPDEAQKTVLRGSLDYRVNAPGGEDLELLTRMVTADVSGVDPESSRPLRAERTVRYQLALERQLGGLGALEVRLFQENANDQLVKTYFKERPGARVGPGGYRLANSGDFMTRGLALSVSRRFGAVSGSLGYTFGRGRVLDAAYPGPFEVDQEQEIHDLTTTVETAIDRTRTRLYAVVKLTSHVTGADEDRSLGSRFNVQVKQGLPFMGWNRTEWEVLVAVRNLFYQDVARASLLDEILIIDSPRRVVGGLAVKF